MFFWVAEIFGWGLPGLFLALTLPITGVSYRLGPTCVPNQKNSFVTWFGWLIAFGCIAALLTSSTTIFCLWVYLKDLGKKNKGGGGGGKSYGNSTQQDDESIAPNTQSGWTSRNSTRKLAWSRVKVVLLAQWRSVLLSTLVIVMVLYYGTVFVKQTNTGLDAVDPDKQAGVTTWAICIVLNSGDKTMCEPLSHVLGLDENAVIAAWFIAGLVGTFTFLLMVRRSMITGWWFCIRHPRQWKRTESIGGQDFFIVGAGGGGGGGEPFEPHNNHDPEHEPMTKRISYSRPLGSDNPRRQNHRPSSSSSSSDHDSDLDDNDSIAEIQPSIKPSHHQTRSGHTTTAAPTTSSHPIYEMQHISPPTLATSNFRSAAAALRSHAPPDSSSSASAAAPVGRTTSTATTGATAATAALVGGGSNNNNNKQTRWSDSTSGGTPSFEAGNVSRRHETSNLFFGGDDDEEEEGEQQRREIGGGNAKTRTMMGGGGGVGGSDGMI